MFVKLRLWGVQCIWGNATTKYLPQPREGFFVNPCPNERSQGEQKRLWSLIIHILKDRKCLLFAEKDLCDGQFIGLYKYVDFVAFGEELPRQEKLLLA